ncbi:MAG: putative porin [Bdellovibrionaceae bacterium]|nr:putative porin [Pseudobdellovibrionaceae bacterium]
MNFWLQQTTPHIQILPRENDSQRQLFKTVMRWVGTMTFAFFLASPLHATEGSAPASWVDKTQLKGDLRFRTDRAKAQGAPEQIRNRIRLRAGLTAQVNEKVDVAFRLTTAGSTADSVISADQTLDDANTKKQAWFDQAYLNWSVTEGSRLVVGKLPVPYWSAGNHDMIWDSDLNLEGSAFKWAQEFNSARMFAHLGGYWFNERAATSADPGPDIFLSGSQIGAAFMTEPVDVQFAVAYYTLAGLADSPSQGRGLRGNSASPASATSYRYDIMPIVLSTEVSLKTLAAPIVVYTEGAQNTAISDDNTAWILGLLIGKLKDPGSWSLNYSYRDLESDAWVGTFNDSDFDAGTNVRFHKLVAAYQIAPAVVGSISAFTGDTTAHTQPRSFDRTQLDFKLDF